MQSQKFNVVHEDDELTVDGGSLAYNLDTATGNLDYTADVSAHWGWLPLPVPTQRGTYKMDMTQMLSSHYSKVGQKLVIGDFVLTVTKIDGHQATCSLSHPQAAGSGVLDIGSQYVKIVSLDAHGTVFKKKAHLVVQAL